MILWYFQNELGFQSKNNEKQLFTNFNISSESGDIISVQ